MADGRAVRSCPAGRGRTVVLLRVDCGRVLGGRLGCGRGDCGVACGRLGACLTGALRVGTVRSTRGVGVEDGLADGLEDDGRVAGLADGLDGAGRADGRDGTGLVPWDWAARLPGSAMDPGATSAAHKISVKRFMVTTH